MAEVIKKEPAAKQSSLIPKIAEKPAKVKRLVTIKLNGNIEYAKVSARVAEFTRQNGNGSITTEYDFKDGWVIFKATVVPNVKNEGRVFKGTSMGKVGAVKAFEKLETIAVGRALAFAGFLSDGEIASSEEMVKYEESPVIVDELGSIGILNKCGTQEELKKAWMALSPEERANPVVLAAKNRIKEFLPNENPSSGTKKSGLAPTPQGEDNGNGTQEDSGNGSSQK